jgi:hypothetical protein
MEPPILLVEEPISRSLREIPHAARGRDRISQDFKTRKKMTTILADASKSISSNRTTTKTTTSEDTFLEKKNKSGTRIHSFLFRQNPRGRDRISQA